MKTTKLLFVGNSFSVNAGTYLHQLADMFNQDIQVTVLYIGGCPIIKHWKNYNDHTPEYDVYINGAKVYPQVDFEKGFQNQKEWDYVSYQQVSLESWNPETYFPELDLLSAELRKRTNAKFVLHETWSYAKNFSHYKYGENPLDQEAMTRDIQNAYREVSKRTGFELVKVGTAIKKAREVFGDIFNADGFHLNEEGNVIAAMVWVKYLCGDVIDFDKFSGKNQLPISIERANEIYQAIKGEI